MQSMCLSTRLANAFPVVSPPGSTHRVLVVASRALLQYEHAGHHCGRTIVSEKLQSPDVVCLRSKVLLFWDTLLTHTLMKRRK